MNTYKVELTQYTTPHDKTTRSTTIEAESRRDVEQIITNVGRLFSIGFASVLIIEVEDPEPIIVEWTEVHRIPLYVYTDEEALEYVKNMRRVRGTTERVESVHVVQNSEIEVSAALVGDYECRSMELLS